MHARSHLCFMEDHFPLRARLNASSDIHSRSGSREYATAFILPGFFMDANALEEAMQTKYDVRRTFVLSKDVSSMMRKRFDQISTLLHKNISKICGKKFKSSTALIE
ncbi:hypothetical protein AVEN_232990-1 [Araneus ventricosus]|uniref:Uncharacterized protein n=1 Tax=Araneus ventricosus TaxID=182803 RepID=A0A4Y2S3C2_ARAVE|nr:hypothetical protein AVEN_232990-1 [Araneus ventricosus]